MPNSPTHDIKTAPTGTIFDPTLFASSREINKPNFDSETLLPSSKSAVVIQGISPLKILGLFLPGTMQSQISPTALMSQSSGLNPITVCLYSSLTTPTPSSSDARPPYSIASPHPTSTAVAVLHSVPLASSPDSPTAASPLNLCSDRCFQSRLPLIIHH